MDDPQPTAVRAAEAASGSDQEFTWPSTNSVIRQGRVALECGPLPAPRRRFPTERPEDDEIRLDDHAAGCSVSGCAGETFALLHQALDAWAYDARAGLGNSRVRPQDQHRLGGGRGRCRRPRRRDRRARRAHRRNGVRPGQQRGHPQRAWRRSRSRPGHPIGAGPVSSSSTTHGRGSRSAIR